MSDEIKFGVYRDNPSHLLTLCPPRKNRFSTTGIYKCVVVNVETSEIFYEKAVSLGDKHF
jgi:hypothetical protein